MAKRLLGLLSDPDGNCDIYMAEDGTLRADFDDSAALTMDKLKEEFANGSNPSAPLRAIFLSYTCMQPIPNWAIEEIARAYTRGVTGDIASWDEAFGRPNTKGQYTRFGSDIDAANQIWKLVAQAKADGKPIDNQLMQTIGEKGFGGKSKVWELYNLACSWRGKP